MAGRLLVATRSSHKLRELRELLEVPADVDYYDVPDDVVVAEPALKAHRYVYLIDHVYVVDSHRRIVAVVN